MNRLALFPIVPVPNPPLSIIPSSLPFTPLFPRPPSPMIDHNPPPPPPLHGQDRHQVPNITSMALQSSGSEWRQFQRWERVVYLAYWHISSTLLRGLSLLNPLPPPTSNNLDPLPCRSLLSTSLAALPLTLFFVVGPHGQDCRQVREDRDHRHAYVQPPRQG